MQLAIQRTSNPTVDSPVTAADPGTFVSFDDVLQTATGQQAVPPVGSCKLPFGTQAFTAMQRQVRGANGGIPTQVTRRTRPESSSALGTRPITPGVVTPDLPNTLPVPPAPWAVPGSLSPTSLDTDEDAANFDVGYRFRFAQLSDPSGEASLSSVIVQNPIAALSGVQGTSSDAEVSPPLQSEAPSSSTVDATPSAAPNCEPGTGAPAPAVEVPFATTSGTQETASALVPFPTVKSRVRPDMSASNRGQGGPPTGLRTHTARSIAPAKNAATPEAKADEAQAETAPNVLAPDAVGAAPTGTSRPSKAHPSKDEASEPERKLTPSDLPAGSQTPTSLESSAPAALSASTPPASTTVSTSNKRDIAAIVSAGSSVGTGPFGKDDLADQVSKLVSAKVQISSPDQLPLNAREGTRAPIPLETASEKASSQLPTPLGTPELQSARLVQTASRSEMRIDLHSQDFGPISVHSTLKRDFVSTQITLQDTQLSTALTTHVQEMEQKVAKDHGFRSTVSVIAQDSGTSSSNQQQQEKSSSHRYSPGRTRNQSQHGSLASVHMPVTHPVMTSTQPPAWAGNQVDLRI